MESTLKSISTELAPKAIGPYSQAIRAGSFLYLSGQIALTPEGGPLRGDTVEAQTEQVMANLRAVLSSEDLTFQNVVKFTVYLNDMKDFPKFNAVYEKYLQPPFPARACVQAAELPKQALVEIDAIACYPNAE